VRLDIVLWGSGQQRYTNFHLTLAVETGPGCSGTEFSHQHRKLKKTLQQQARWVTDGDGNHIVALAQATQDEETEEEEAEEEGRTTG